MDTTLNLNLIRYTVAIAALDYSGPTPGAPRRYRGMLNNLLRGDEEKGIGGGKEREKRGGAWRGEDDTPPAICGNSRNGHPNPNRK